MRLLLSVLLLTLPAMLAGCGEPLRGMDEDAKAAKAQAHEAISAAEAAARSVDELSRQNPAETPTEQK